MSGLPNIGDVIDETYRVTKKIGQGGFGAVFLARHIHMERDVALKMLLAHGPNPEEMVERFKREVLAIRSLAHPNTVRIFDFRDSIEGTHLYYAMEYLKGVNLKDLLKAEGSQSPRRVHHIARQVLKSLAEAHSYGIIHRDLKPANIMLVDMYGEDDFVKVLDFGIAKIMESEDDENDPLTSAGMLVGTLQYMSPEQIKGEPLGPFSDIYALGLICAELLAGQSVFAGTGRWEVLQKQVSPDPIELPPKMEHTPLGQVFRRALSKDPEQRYRAAEDMLADLDTIEPRSLSDEPALQVLPEGEAFHVGPHSSSSSHITGPNAAPTTGSGLHATSDALGQPLNPEMDDAKTLVHESAFADAQSGTQPAPQGRSGHTPAPASGVQQRANSDHFQRTTGPVAAAQPEARQPAHQITPSHPFPTNPGYETGQTDMSAAVPADTSGHSKTLIAIIGGLLVVVALGAGAFVMMNGSTNTAARVPANAAFASSDASDTPNEAPTAERDDPAPAAEEASDPAEDAVATRKILVHPDESDVEAEIFEGEELLGRTPHFVTLEEGTPRTLRFVAEGHEDTSVTVPFDAPEKYAVTLKASPAPEAEEKTDSPSRSARKLVRDNARTDDTPEPRAKRPEPRPEPTPAAKKPRPSKPKPAEKKDDDWMDVSVDQKKEEKKEKEKSSDVPLF